MSDEVDTMKPKLPGPIDIPTNVPLKLSVDDPKDESEDDN